MLKMGNFATVFCLAARNCFPTHAKVRPSGPCNTPINQESRRTCECATCMPPLFHTPANDPTVTSFRISAFPRTPHRVMPNLIPKAEETDDIVACILSLKNNSGKP